MDYNLAALKLFCGQLKHARQTPSSSPAMTIGSILFQRAWLQVLFLYSFIISVTIFDFFAVQGVLVLGSEEGQFILDDGSSVVELSLSNEFRLHEWKSGLNLIIHIPKSSVGRTEILNLIAFFGFLGFDFV